MSHIIEEKNRYTHTHNFCIYEINALSHSPKKTKLFSFPEIFFGTNIIVVVLQSQKRQGVKTVGLGFLEAVIQAS